MRKPVSEVVFTHETPRGWLSAQTRAHKARKLAPRLYTTNLVDAPDVILRRNVWRVVAGYFPDAMLADRTALELSPASDGSVFFITAKPHRLDLPGLLLRPRLGVGPLAGDYDFREGLKCTSMARAYLENMRASRRRVTVSRTVSRSELEGRLERFVRNSGEDAFNRMRDNIRRLGGELGMVEEAEKLSAIMGTLLGTKHEKLTHGAAVARAAGEAVDTRRVDVFHSLHDALRQIPPLDEVVDDLDADAFKTRAFCEAYFSNFIEGTEFELDEAERIVFKGEIPKNRPSDSHDILGTYALVSDRREMSRSYEGENGFLDTLKQRHKMIMHGRSNAAPGEFKEIGNRAGSTSFVHPDAVTGTLKEGYRMVERLDDPFQRAAAMMFVVAEVHPFNDGNGRLARAMMNAELLRARHSPILIPTVYRDNYLAALRRLTHHGDPEAYIRMLMFAHRYGRTIPWAERDVAFGVLERTHAFERAEEAEAKGRFLRLATGDDVLAVRELMATAKA